MNILELNKFYPKIKQGKYKVRVIEQGKFIYKTTKDQEKNKLKS